jgi:hypothetical protein
MIGYVLAGAVLIAFVAYQLSNERRRRSDAPLSTASDGLDPVSVSYATDDSQEHHHHHGDDQTGDFGGHHGGDVGGHHGGDYGGTDFGGGDYSGSDFGGHHD